MISGANKMINKKIVRTLSTRSLIVVFTIVLAKGSFANVTKKELKERCEQNISQKLGSSANVLHSDVEALCETIDLIPGDSVDNELASWIASSYWDEVNGDGTAPAEVDLRRHRIEGITKLAQRVCPLITHTGKYYKEQGQHLITVSREIRAGMFNPVKERIASAKIISLDVSNASYSDSVKNIAEAFDPSIGNSDDQDWNRDYSDRIESQIISLALVRAIYYSMSINIIHDQFQYAIDLFPLVMHLDKSTQEKIGQSLHDYSSVKTKIGDFLDETLYVKDGVTYIDWGNLSLFLNSRGSLMWENNYQTPSVNRKRKIVYIITPVQNMSELLHKNDLAILKTMLWKKGRDNTKLLQSIRSNTNS